MVRLESLIFDYVQLSLVLLEVAGVHAVIVLVGEGVVRRVEDGGEGRLAPLLVYVKSSLSILWRLLRLGSLNVVLLYHRRLRQDGWLLHVLRLFLLFSFITFVILLLFLPPHHFLDLAQAVGASVAYLGKVLGGLSCEVHRVDHVRGVGSALRVRLLSSVGGRIVGFLFCFLYCARTETRVLSLVVWVRWEMVDLWRESDAKLERCHFLLPNDLFIAPRLRFFE